MTEKRLKLSVHTGRKLNVHKTSSERLMYVQFTSCVYEASIKHFKRMHGKTNYLKRSSLSLKNNSYISYKGIQSIPQI